VTAVRENTESSWAQISLLPIILFLVIAPVLMAMPSPFSREVMTYDEQRLLELLMCGFSLALLVGGLARVGWTIGRNTLIVGALCLVLGAASIMLAPAAQREAWRDWLTWCLLLLVTRGIAVALATARQGTQRLVVATIGASVLAYMIWLLILHVKLYFLRESGNTLYILIPGFGNIRFFSDWQSFVIPFLPVAISEHCRTRWLRSICFVIACLFFSLAFYAQSRSLFLGQFVALASLLVLRAGAWRTVLLQYIAYWAGGLLLFLTLGALGWHSAFGIEGGLIRGGLSGRGALWLHTLSLSAEHPWLGVGPGLFSLYRNPVAAGPHNSILTIAVEWGWPVCAAMVVGVGLLLRNGISILQSEDAESASGRYSVAFWLGTVALLTQSMVSGVITTPISQVCLVAGLAWMGSHDRVTFASPRVIVFVSWHWLGLSSIAVILALAPIVTYDVTHLPERNRQFRACSSPPPLFAPKYWAQGWIMDACP
jgi:putative inorganic carbon (HCO3(-)) transporter